MKGSVTVCFITRACSKGFENIGGADFCPPFLFCRDNVRNIFFGRVFLYYPYRQSAVSDGRMQLLIFDDALHLVARRVFYE